MTLYDFIEMAVDNIYDCYVWDNNKEENIFEGKMYDIPDELLELEVTSCEISEGKIGFNVE